MIKLFDYDYCANCFHPNHPGWMCILDMWDDELCECIEPVSEEERGQIIVTLGSCEKCNHRNHTGYGQCWYKKSVTEMGGRLSYIPCQVRAITDSISSS